MVTENAKKSILTLKISQQATLRAKKCQYIIQIG